VGASDFVSDLTALETHIDLGTWYSLRRQSASVAFGIKLQPKPDKYYFFEVVDDGGGVERITQVIEGVQQTPQGSTAVTREAVYEDDNTIRITAMFAKKFFDFLVLRAGIIESSGGVGADLVFFDDRLLLRTDIYNWGGPRNRIQSPDLFYPGFTLPRWRTMVKAQPIPYAYIMLGVDDVLNTFDLNYGSDGFGQVRNPAFHGYGLDFFFGLGISFKDDDLRNILPFIPSL
jgi:phospholipid/cholesterol/gamma-HCH transport system substrate-binding protein